MLGKRLNAKFRSILCDHDISPSQSIQESLTQAIKDSFAYVDRRLCQSIFQLLPSSFYQQGTYFTGNMRTAFRHDFEKHIKVESPLLSNGRQCVWTVTRTSQRVAFAARDVSAPV